MHSLVQQLKGSPESSEVCSHCTIVGMLCLLLELWGLDADLWKWLSVNSICLPKRVPGRAGTLVHGAPSALQLFACAPAVTSPRKEPFPIQLSG